jgi:hypothetical protein
MKRVKPSVVVLILTACALLFTSANQSAAGQSDYYARSGNGVLRLKHSPVLGINIPITVWIDGVQSGAFAKGHVYERELAPGLHDLYLRRPGRKSDAWFGTLDIRPGETQSFVVKCTPYRVILKPVIAVN